MRQGFDPGLVFTCCCIQTAGYQTRINIIDAFNRAVRTSGPHDVSVITASNCCIQPTTRLLSTLARRVPHPVFCRFKPQTTALNVPANRLPIAADDRGVRNRASSRDRARWHKKIGLTRRGLNLVNPKIQDSHYSFQVGKRQDGSCVGKYRMKVPSPTQTCQRPTNRGIQFRLRNALARLVRFPRWPSTRHCLL